MASDNHAVFTFGRFNPPTEAGHGKLVSAVQSHAEKVGGSHYIFPSHTQDKSKNPLSHSDKVHAMKKMFPNTNVVSHEKVRTAIDAMKHLESKGHTHVTMVVGSDRVPEFHKMLNKYNGKEYNFKKIHVKSAGHRDPDAEGAEGMSASKLRGLVKSGKREEFVSHYSDKKLGAHIHDKVKEAMSESIKAMFIFGGPGSGKDYVINNILNRFNLVEVQLDQILMGSVKELVESGANLLINAPADMEKIALVRNTLGENYEFSYTLVSVTNKVSRERNEVREKPMNESVRIRKWLDAEKATDISENVFVFKNSIDLKEASQPELDSFQEQIAQYLGFLLEEGFLMAEKKFPPVAKDKETGLPKKYVSGLSSSTAAARKAHWKKMSKLSDKDPRAYEPAPGDKTAKTKPSKHTLAVRKMMKEGAADSSLAAKAKKSGVSVATLKKVYRRGVAAWNSGHRPGTTPSQWGHARVNSYINKGKTYHTADKDLRENETVDEIYTRGIEKLADKTEKIEKQRRIRDLRVIHHQNRHIHKAAIGEETINERQLEGTDEYRRHAVQMTPGQVDPVFNKPQLTIGTKKKIKSKIVPPKDMNARIDGAGGYSIGGLTQTMSQYATMENVEIPELPTLEEAVKYHQENNLSLVENVFRPGSDMFFQIIKEAKRLYKEGSYIPRDDFEKALLEESDLGETGVYNGQTVWLDLPFDEELNEEGKSDPTGGHGIGKPWREGGGGAVYVRTGSGGVKKVRFSQSGMSKRYREPGRLKSFMARHHCLTNKDKTSASYWACRYPRFFSNTGQLWW